MTFVGCFFFVSPTQAQGGPQEIGAWSYLRNQNQAVVVWRQSMNPSWDQAVGDYAAANSWNDIYGIHAALLPNSSLAGESKRGWVILWGYGKERAYPITTFPRLLSQTADPFFPINHYVARVVVTPVLLWNPKDSNPYGYVRYLFDTDTWNALGNWPVYNLFCAGHAFLPDGSLFMAGGDSVLWSEGYPSQEEADLGYVGLRLAAIFQSGNFHPANLSTSQPLWYANHPMQEPRWYPMVVALPDGRLLIVGGTRWGIEGGEKKQTTIYEVYEPCENVFNLEGIPSVPENLYNALSTNYPRLHLVSYLNNQNQVRARIVYTGLFTKNFWLDAFYPLHPPLWQSYGPQRSVERMWGSSVLIPNVHHNPSSWNQQRLNQVMVLGGNSHGGVTTSTEFLTFTLNDTLTIAAGPSMNHPRSHLNAVLLPTDEIFAFGGVRVPPDLWIYPDDVVYETELYTKNAQGNYFWKAVASNLTSDAVNDGIQDVTRVYHSSGLLLPDGRVLTAGSATKDQSDPQMAVNNHVPTIYWPPYLFIDGAERSPSQRPQILSVSDPSHETPEVDLNYSQNFSLTYQLHNGSGGVRSVVLIRPASVTHSFNSEQRLVKLRFVVNSESQIQVTAPWHQAMAPPGWYMLFLVSHDGVPSEAQWVRLKLADCYAPEGSVMRISFEDLSSSLSAEQKESWERSPLTAEFRDPETGTVESSYTLSLPAPDEQGQWSWTVPADGSSGLYELYVTPYRSWLGHRQIVDRTSTRRVATSLRNGDVNGDNGVDALDLEIAMSQMGAMDSAGDQVLSGDVNADGVVDSQDIDIILANIVAMGAR